MAEPRRSIVFRFPKWIDERLHWWDLNLNRIDKTWLHKHEFLEGYSSFALWLPIPLILFLVYGLPAYLLPPWRGWGLFAVTIAAIAVHILLCRSPISHILRPRQWLLLVGVALGVWCYALVALPMGRHWDAAPYAHLYALLGVLVLTVAMPISQWLARRLIAGQRSELHAAYAANLQRTQLFIGGEAPPDSWGRVFRALFLAPIAAPVLLALIPALFVLLTPRVVSWQVTLVLFMWWFILGAAFYNERLTKFRELLHASLLTGWPLVLSLFIVAVAVARLLNVSYVATVLDQPSTSGVIVGGLLLSYLLFWQHDYWEERAFAEVLLDLLRDKEAPYPSSVAYRGGRLQIHGAGRLIAIREVAHKDHKEEFQYYRPLQVFGRIVEQLECRARGESDRTARKALWQEVDRTAHLLDMLRQKMRLYYTLLLVLPSVLVLAASYAIYVQQQEPSLTASANEPTNTFDLGKALQTGSSKQPRFIVAASGGGTRAALYTYSLLRGLKDRGALDRVVLVSGVSGGSLGIAHFAAHRRALLDEPTSGKAWRAYRNTVSAPHIKYVLAGTGELRLATGTRLGELLTESFIREIYGGTGRRDECIPGKDGGARVLADLNGAGSGIGVIFNTAVSGSWQGGAATAECMKTKQTGLGLFFGWGMRKCATVTSSGSRLVISNLSIAEKEGFPSPIDRQAKGWPFDLEYAVVRDPNTCLATAASLSANFPPVFSNSAVHFNGSPESRYWVTDGGAVENRGVMSALLALRAQLRSMLKDHSLAKPMELPPIKVLVAEASAFSMEYAEDRGVGAKFSASSAIANKLIAELASETDVLYRSLTGNSAGIEILYLPMPDTLRVSGAFGTHWAMPASIDVRNPATRFQAKRRFWRPGGTKTVTITEKQLLELMDVLFSDQQERNPLEIDPDFWSWIRIAGEDPRERLDRATSP
jgi:hypothetical protein